MDIRNKGLTLRLEADEFSIAPGDNEVLNMYLGANLVRVYKGSNGWHITASSNVEVALVSPNTPGYFSRDPLF